MTIFPHISPICTVVSLTSASTAFHNRKSRQKHKSLLLPAFSTHFHSGRQDLNLRPLDPQSIALGHGRYLYAIVYGLGILSFPRYSPIEAMKSAFSAADDCPRREPGTWCPVRVAAGFVAAGLEG